MADEIEEIRGLANHYAAEVGGWTREQMTTYETEALLGWVRRRMARHIDGHCTGPHATDWDPCGGCDREALAHAVMLDLGGALQEDPHGEHGLAWTLCEAAGWPS